MLSEMSAYCLAKMLGNRMTGLWRKSPIGLKLLSKRLPPAFLCVAQPGLQCSSHAFLIALR